MSRDHRNYRELEQQIAESSQDDFVPGTGCLTTTIQDKVVPVPLKHTDVKASITGYISSVAVAQQFHNPFDSKIEAVYVFPLPENSAVSDFIMTIGDRTIRGIIREKEEAQQIYTQARAQGHVASLLTQERPNIFTQKVANIEPGKSIDINITYYGTLTYSDGGYEFAFPMVVGPRFNPPGTTDGIGAAPRDQQGVSGQPTEVTYLRPTERTSHDISLSLDINAGVSIEKLECTSHVIDVQRPTPTTATVRLAADDTIPNRDFVLRYTIAGDSIKPAILAHEDSRGGFFTMMLVPPRDLANVPRNPVEMVFVLDCSGSMQGHPMEQGKAAIAQGLTRLQPGDSFQIIDFSLSASQLGPRPVEANRESIQRGMAYLNSLSAYGGTMMMTGLRASLDFPHDPARLRFVSFVTDGFIGNEPEILGELHNRLGSSRIFSFGVGSCNRYLMDSMARMGSGLTAYLGMNDHAPAIMDAFFDRVSHAPMSDLSIDWGSARISEVYPSRLPDLFVGRPVILTGRFHGTLPETIRITGRVGNERQEIVVSPAAPAAAERTALPQVWARTKLAEVADRATWDANSELTQTARQTALDYNLMSPFTAFVAVDSLYKTAGEYGTTVIVPMPVPQGVRYETTVPDAGGAESAAAQPR